MSNHEACRQRFLEVIDERPLDTETAAPPVVPPRRPIVALAMLDDADARQQQFEAKVRELRVANQVLLAAHQETKAALERLRPRLDEGLK